MIRAIAAGGSTCSAIRSSSLQLTISLRRLKKLIGRSPTKLDPDRASTKDPAAPQQPVAYRPNEAGRPTSPKDSKRHSADSGSSLDPAGGKFFSKFLARQTQPALGRGGCRGADVGH